MDEFQQAMIEIRKYLAGEIRVKAEGDGNAELEAILSEVNVVDLDGDKILPGAFDEAIADKAEPSVLYMHRRGDIVGNWRELRMDGTKLKGNATLYTGEGGFELARQALYLARNGRLSGVSIGFRVRQFMVVRDDEDRPYGWDIAKLDLIEASLVDKPANESAQVTEIKQRQQEADSSARLLKAVRAL